MFFFPHLEHIHAALKGDNSKSHLAKRSDFLIAFTALHPHMDPYGLIMVEYGGNKHSDEL